MKVAFGFLAVTALSAQSWIPQNSGVTVSLRGLGAVDANTAWASGAGGTWLRTLDGGQHWNSGVVPGTSDLDFRGVRAFSANEAVLMSIGAGEKSRVYKTRDGGMQWTLLFTNPDPKGFFDGIAFWDAKHGVLFGDAVDGHMTVFTTDDGGAHWKKQPTPPALPNEGAFAASNSSLTIFGTQEAWFGTGGASNARVYHSTDRGQHWTVVTTPIRSDGSSAGVFSLAFRDRKHGIAVGGDYRKDKETDGNIAITDDGGAHWRAPGSRPHGFRSAVEFSREERAWIVTGTSGSDISHDNGSTWIPFDSRPFNALSGRWAAGGKGQIGVFSPAAAPPQ